ncbi:MAG: asparagine synthase (glutamine-hydrolyzing) [Thermodesulfobacteriota bacterium]
MCGICGIVDFSKPPMTSVVQHMSEAMRHRGPDAGGVYAFGPCVLGHRRLSILDLSDAANQPMVSEDGQVGLVFNGEIYNFQPIRAALLSKGHRFKTESDTEVLLQLYREKGPEMMADLNGMCAFAIWDDQARRLVMGRDRMGKKPLYYRADQGRIAFASEPTALLCDPNVTRDVWDQAVSEFFLYDFIPGSHTIFKGVHRLPPASVAVFDEGGLRIRSYWEPPCPRTDLSDSRQPAERLRELLDDAVRMRLISDVPLGAFLSGGIDSTLITALMTRHSLGRVKTFSISFPGTTHDESRWSRIAAHRVGSDHSEHAVDLSIEELLPELVRHFGEPFGDSSAIPTWHLCRETRRHVTVALSGDGGDELFGGYERYLARRLQVLYELLPERLRDRVIEPLIDRVPATTDYYGTNLSKKLKLFVQAARRMREDPLAVIPRTFSLAEARELTQTGYAPELDPVYEVARQWSGLDPVTRMLFSDMQTYLAEDILTKVDRMSMAHSLEVRAPLLDYRVVEFACELPLRCKIRGMTTKRVLKAASRGLVPGEIIRRSKYGFQVPLGTWFKGGLRNWARERLLDSGHGLLNQRFVERLWNEHLAGKADHTHKLWSVIVFNEWFAARRPV